MSSSASNSEAGNLRLSAGSLEETARIGQSLGSLLFPGAVVALIGPLGAGKTWFTRNVAIGLGLSRPEQVTSPTFVLIQEYAARLPIYHFDVYRLKQLSEFEDLGALEYLAGDGVCLIEWADRVSSLLPTEYLRIEFELTGPASRVISFTAFGERYYEMIEHLRESYTKSAATPSA
ncbi:MAG TPA: tRNA (adenosine(37)-N6)-threonylcarbamoyltransferase complex ATPase subunit type 1 TsaE [Gemmatales bacterium]|nr:tRNA (adenosine(37)-N6)-threonylcarbamoyltransferase complex ATPase subunit type 1 TsaE [Gemmatales bacterium]